MLLERIPLSYFIIRHHQEYVHGGRAGELLRQIPENINHNVSMEMEL
jgi:hypothetical protein